MLAHLIQYFQQIEHNDFHNVWINMRSLQVYVRFWERPVNGMQKWCMDVAAIEVKERYRGQGHFSIFMDLVQSFNPGEVTYLENVLNPHLKAWCARHGWEKALPASESAPCFFLIKRDHPALLKQGPRGLRIDWNECLQASPPKTFEVWSASHFS
jgi:hypothetical protein